MISYICNIHKDKTDWWLLGILGEGRGSNSMCLGTTDSTLEITNKKHKKGKSMVLNKL